MSFLGYVVVIITAIGLYFLTWRRIKNSPNIARFFYVLSIVAFYVGLFKSETDSVFVAIFDAVSAGFFWFFIGLLIERFSDKKLNKSPIVPVADEIKKLAQLKEEGILTEEEFSQQKNKLLSN